MGNKSIDLLKSFFKRLIDGESIETVRKDISDSLDFLELEDIFKSEELLMIDGVDIEKIVGISHFYPQLFSDKLKNINENIELPHGHPFQVMKSENDFLEKLFEREKDSLKDSDESETLEIIKRFKVLKFHYEKKSDLFYPLLKKDYRFLSPSSVMWGGDEEIVDSLSDLYKKKDISDIIKGLSEIIEKGESMIFKERYILGPLCLEKLSDIDWMRIYYELDAYEYILKDNFPIWEEAEKRYDDLKTIGGKIACEVDDEEIKKSKEYITIGSGMMTPEQIDKIFEKIPMEITFVDEKNINRYYDKGENKVFKRPDMSIGRDMFSCHPGKLLPVVRDIILDFRTGKKDSVNLWIKDNEEPVYIMYIAIRDDDGNYLGTLECVQRLGFAFEKFEKMKK